MLLLHARLRQSQSDGAPAAVLHRCDIESAVYRICAMIVLNGSDDEGVSSKVHPIRWLMRIMEVGPEFMSIQIRVHNIHCDVGKTFILLVYSSQG